MAKKRKRGFDPMAHEMAEGPSDDRFMMKQRRKRRRKNRREATTTAYQGKGNFKSY